MQSKEHSISSKINKNPEHGLNTKFLANLTAYFVRQNVHYGIPLSKDFGLAPKVYQDFRDLRTAKKRKEFVLNQAELFQEWHSAMKTRLSEIKTELKDESLSNAERTELAMEAFEIDRQATEFSELLDIDYGGRKPYKLRINS